MTLSKSDQKLLSLLIEERNKLIASDKAYRHQSSIDKLTRSIVGIRNTIVYESMEWKTASSLEEAGFPVMRNPDGSVIRLLKKGESISLRMF